MELFIASMVAGTITVLFAVMGNIVWRESCEDENFIRNEIK